MVKLTSSVVMPGQPGIFSSDAYWRPFGLFPDGSHTNRTSDQASWSCGQQLLPHSQTTRLIFGTHCSARSGSVTWRLEVLAHPPTVSHEYRPEHTSAAMAKYSWPIYLYSQGSLSHNKIECLGPTCGKSLAVLRTAWHGASESSLHLGVSNISSVYLFPKLKQCLYRLSVSSNSWAMQVKHFSGLPQYSTVVFDNRGVGNSDTPMGPYSSVLSPVVPFHPGWQLRSTICQQLQDECDGGRSHRTSRFPRLDREA